MSDQTDSTCSHCGGSQIVRAVHMGPTADGLAGLKYQSRFFLTGTEPLVADLCNACGTVTRLYVKEVGKNWWTAK